jgi:GT2 family glycosyltransferase
MKNEVSKMPALSIAFMLLRREAIDRAGIFDTSFFIYGEDIDLSWRIRKAGFYNYYLHDVSITHFKGKSSVTDRESSVRHFYNAMKIFSSKHLNRAWQLPVKAGVTLLQTCALASLRLRQSTKN